MVSTCSTSTARDASPTPSENSDLYYKDTPSFYDEDEYIQSTRATPTAADHSDATPTPADADHTDATPTPMANRGTSPDSVVELDPKEYPPLPTPTPPATAIGSRNKANKKKEKGKARARGIPQPTPELDADDAGPFLAKDIELAKAASLGLTTVIDHATTGASSSRRPAAAQESPSKRLRSNTVGNASPGPFTAVTAPSNDAGQTNGTSPFLAPIQTRASTTAQHQPPTIIAVALPAAAAQPAAAAVAAAPYAAVVAGQPAATAANVHPASPLWLTADGLPPRGSYTPTPPGGFPEFMYSRALLYQGIPNDLKALYDAVDQPKFFLVVSGGNGVIMQTHGLIRDAIGNFINIPPTDFQLGTPPSVANGPNPVLWLVAGIPMNLAQAIVSQRVLTSRHITLFAISYEMPVNGFVGTYIGLTLPNTPAGATIAQGLFRDAVLANGDISQFVQTHCDAFGPQVSAEQALDIFVTSIAVVALQVTVNKTVTVSWQLHVVSPTNDHDTWLQLCRLFGRLSIMTALCSTARLQRAFRCHLCPSIAHPTDLCPFPALPGWLGPTLTTIKDLEEASRQAAAKAREHIRNNSDANGSSSRPNSNRGPGPAHNGKKPRKDGKGKGRGNFKGKGKRREYDGFF
ncbi:hypothetical protein B0H19DRAFT_1079063 [Mycena capillaripes]|nr:hypothetical protein B0H19DRAFT_1079063 [Mycena capillaripes]